MTARPIKPPLGPPPERLEYELERDNRIRRSKRPRRVRPGAILRAWAAIWARLTPGKWAPFVPQYWIDLWDARVLAPSHRSPAQVELLADFDEKMAAEKEPER